MPIEILYIFPIVSLAIFVFILIYYHQKKNIKLPQRIASDFAVYQKLFDDAKNLFNQNEIPKEKLNKYESTLEQINKSLSKQHDILEKIQEENINYKYQIEKLKSKLSELQKEYDIVISENYSLRAKIKSMQNKDLQNLSPENLSSHFKNQSKEHIEMNMNLYEDTRLFNPSSLEEEK
jgi:chromosome segregation ATPase